MKLVNLLIRRITILFTIIMLLWSGLYLWLQMYEIHDGNDEGLINLKQEFIAKANMKPGFIENMEREQPINLQLREISFEEAAEIVENFRTTHIYFATELEEEEVRMFTSAFLCQQNGKYYEIQFFASTVESDDIIQNILYLTLGLWIVLIITLILVSRLIISRSNKPFYKLLKELKNFRLGNSRPIDLPATKIEEYAQLNDAVKELISKNINIFTEQREFIENCSHELQTPLAVAIARLELLTEKYQNDEAHVEELAELLTILSRMKRLNTSLLLLSKIKNNQFVGIQKVDLNEELRKVLDELSDFISYKELSVEFDAGQTIEKDMNIDLAHTLFTNLLKNAIMHNEHSGKIVITSAPKRITIANTGTESLESTFDRYRSGTAGSTGIGLSIVKSIVDLYKIKIRYHFEEGNHIFTLDF